MSNEESSVKVEEVTIEDEGSDDEMPQLEPVQEAEVADQGPRTINRLEKKARKALMKFGLTPVAGVTKVGVFDQDKKTLFIINNPDVFQASKTAKVIFGEASLENENAALAQQLQAQAAQFSQGAEAEDEDMPELTPAADGAADDGEVDEKHIELVLEQVEGATREQAIAALKESGGDLVGAIMQLS